MLWFPGVDHATLHVSLQSQQRAAHRHKEETMNTKHSVALVSGANRGIGRAFVETLLERGARRIYAAARNPTLLEPVVALDQARVIPLKLDITNRHDVQAAADIATDVNVLINNAGVLASGGLLSSDIGLLRQDIDTNYFGTLTMLRHFVPIIERNGGGAIANILTLIALASMPGFGGYSASKAAAYSMTQALRAELAQKNIRIHAVLPGAVDTDMLRGVDMPKASPQDVAQTVLSAMEAGEDDIFPDPMAQSAHAIWLQNPKALERQFGAM
jgi:NAD(P)-dependent dehydrogenase (short-subunit alcohol dehydrogenase family)